MWNAVEFRAEASDFEQIFICYSMVRCPVSSLLKYFPFWGFSATYGIVNRWSLTNWLIVS